MICSNGETRRALLTYQDVRVAAAVRLRPADGQEHRISLHVIIHSRRACHIVTRTRTNAPAERRRAAQDGAVIAPPIETEAAE